MVVAIPTLVHDITDRALAATRWKKEHRIKHATPKNLALFTAA